MSQINKTLLVAATTTGSSEVLNTVDLNSYTFIIKATGVTTGGVHKINARMPDGTLVPVDSRTISATGTTVIAWTGAFLGIQSQLSSVTDGTYTTYLIAQ